MYKVIQEHVHCNTLKFKFHSKVMGNVECHSLKPTLMFSVTSKLQQSIVQCKTALNNLVNTVWREKLGITTTYIADPQEPPAPHDFLKIFFFSCQFSVWFFCEGYGFSIFIFINGPLVILKLLQLKNSQSHANPQIDKPTDQQTTRPI